jgi:hypothetical protein
VEPYLTRMETEDINTVAMEAFGEKITVTGREAPSMTIRKRRPRNRMVDTPVESAYIRPHDWSNPPMRPSLCGGPAVPDRSQLHFFS